MAHKRTRTIVSDRGSRTFTYDAEYPTNLAALVEFGTAPHTLGKGSKASVKGKNQWHGRQSRVTRGAQHPGVKAQPFMRPALDNHVGSALEAFGQTVGKALDKAIGHGTSKAQHFSDFSIGDDTDGD